MLGMAISDTASFYPGQLWKNLTDAQTIKHNQIPIILRYPQQSLIFIRFLISQLICLCPLILGFPLHFIPWKLQFSEIFSFRILLLTPLQNVYIDFCLFFPCVKLLKYAEFYKNVLVDNLHTMNGRQCSTFSFFHAWLPTKQVMIKIKITLYRVCKIVTIYSVLPSTISSIFSSWFFSILVSFSKQKDFSSSRINDGVQYFWSLLIKGSVIWKFFVDLNISSSTCLSGDTVSLSEFYENIGSSSMVQVRTDDFCTNLNCNYCIFVVLAFIQWYMVNYII